MLSIAHYNPFSIHRKISRPYFPTKLHSPIVSYSSSTSTTKTKKPLPTATALRTSALTILSHMSHLNHPSASDAPLTALQTLISPTATFQHEDDAPYPNLSSFLSAWQTMLALVPDFRLEVVEAVADVRDRKVWVRSLITGTREGDEEGFRVENCCMMRFDARGILVECGDSERAVRRQYGHGEGEGIASE